MQLKFIEEPHVASDCHIGQCGPLKLKMGKHLPLDVGWEEWIMCVWSLMRDAHH